MFSSGPLTEKAGLITSNASSLWTYQKQTARSKGAFSVIREKSFSEGGGKKGMISHLNFPVENQNKGTNYIIMAFLMFGRDA